MLRYVYGHDETVAQFVAQLIPHAHGRTLTGKAIGVIDDEGKLIAGIVYHQYDPVAETIEITGAALPGSRWLTRETIQRMYQYPFEQLGVQMIVHRTPANTEHLLEQLARRGYMLVKWPRMLGRDRDGVLCLFTSEAWDQCKFNSKRKKPERGNVEFMEWLNEEAA